MSEFSEALIIGKFMPVHEGHLAMIGFAAERAGIVNVLLGALPGEEPEGRLRFTWLEECVRRWGNVRAHFTDEELPTAAESDREVSRVWAAWLKKRFPTADAIVSSETYGDYLAEYMGIRHLPFDPGRGRVPVSATVIRERPWLHWDCLPPPARAHFAKAVCVYGPESTGKTTITEKLARRFRTEWVPEMARIYIGEREPVKDDIDAVAVLHAREIASRRKGANRILFVDSDLITTRVYADVLFGYHPAFPAAVEAENRYDLHLLLDVDVPWVDDVQRRADHDRAAMFSRFRKELDDRSLPYEIISGGWEAREEACVRAVEAAWPGMLESCLRGAKG